VRLRHDHQLSFADFELEQQGILPDAETQAVSDFLDGLPEATRLVHEDLTRGLSRPARGRRGLTAECVLRSLVAWRMNDWTYRELRERVADGHALREFTRFRTKPVPRHDAFQRAFARVRPETLRRVNDMVVEAARKRGLAKGEKLRVDATVVASDIHYPTDASLLSDTVRVLTRLTKGLGALVPRAVQGFHDRTCCAKKRAYEIQRLARGNKKAKMRLKYRELVRVTEEVLRTAGEAVERVRESGPGDLLGSLGAAALAERIEHFRELGRRVVSQTRRRVFEGESVPAREKVVSIFEPHTDVIVRKKAGKSAEYGHKVFLAETEGGWVLLDEVVDGNPPDAPWVTPALEKHVQVFGKAPQVFAGDRGFYSRENVETCAEAGVENESIPYKGRRRPPDRTDRERSPDFKAAQRFRNGVEGRISVLARGRGMRKCPLRGRDRFDFFVASAVLANNLKCTAAAALKQKNQVQSEAAA
jgi:IS5 family transposase